MSRVLIACEFSGIIRDAFKARGHNAWSCDLLPTERPGQHIQDDVLKHLDEEWDMMIAHPPCTYLTVSANRWYKDQPPRKSEVLVGIARRIARERAINFFIKLAEAKINKICLENPVGIMSTVFGKPDQIIQPYQFGHGETKSTCLWLKNLPKLIPTEIVSGREHRIWKMPPSPNRSKERSLTYIGIAKAMVSQWG